MSISSQSIVLDANPMPTKASGSPSALVAVSVLTDANGSPTATISVALTGMPSVAPSFTLVTHTTIVSEASSSSTPSTPPQNGPTNIPAPASVVMLIVFPLLIGLALFIGLGVCIYRRRRASRQANLTRVDSWRSNVAASTRYRARLREMTDIDIRSMLSSRRNSRKIDPQAWDAAYRAEDRIPPLPELPGDPKSGSDSMFAEKKPVRAPEVNEFESGTFSRTSR